MRFQSIGMTRRVRALVRILAGCARRFPATPTRLFSRRGFISEMLVFDHRSRLSRRTILWLLTSVTVLRSIV
jgi:hypothetical protein